MKQIKKQYKRLGKILGIFALIVFTTLSSLQLPIKAATNQPATLGQIAGTGAVLRQGGRTAWWGAIDKISVNGEIAFCVEPMVIGLNGAYSISDFDISTQRTLSRIVYHGWDTSAKTDNDYATTQFMIWEALGATITQWNGSFGNVYPTLKANIQAKINSHNVFPSFANTGGYEVNSGETISFYDNNYVINQLHVVDNGGTTAWIEDNKLHVIPNENTPDNTKITLQKFSDEHVGASIAYRSSASNGQDVGLFKLDDPGHARVEINVKKFGHIEAVKVDKDTIAAHGDATLEGAIYGLYANEDITNKATGTIIHAKDSLIDTRTTDKGGKMLPFEKLNFGEYYLKEIQAPNGYMLSDEKVVVQVQPNQTINATVQETIKRGQFSLSKGISIESDSSEILTPEVGAEFITVLKKYVEKYGTIEEAYAHKDEFANDEYDLLVTDNKGYAQSKELAYGMYVSKQIKGDTESLLLNETWETMIDGDKNNEKHYLIKNQAFQPYVKIVKKDKETGEVVSFGDGIYKIKNVDTGEFLTQKIGNKYVSEFQTENGMIVLPLKVNPGNYELIEVKAPNGYLIDSTPIPFTISQSNIHETDKDDEPVYTVEISNQRVKGQIEVTKQGQVLTNFEDGQFIYENKALPNAEFGLYARKDIIDIANGNVIYPKGTEIAKQVTNETGVATFQNLPLGEYYVKELKAPYGYVVDEKEYDVEISYKDENTPIVTSSIKIYNEKQNYTMNITKIDEESKETLQGAEFTLYANRDIYNIDQEVIVPAGTALEAATSNKNGNVKFTLDLPTDFTDPYKPMPISDEELDPEFNVDYDYVGGVEMYGNPNSLFVVKETKAPESYELKPAHYYVDTIYQGQDKEEITISHEAINNKIKATIQVNKVDTFTQQPIISKDFAFGLYADERCKELIEKVHANTEDGTATFKDVVYGTYYVKEIEAPIGYMLSDEVKKVEITETGVYVNGEKVEEENQVYSFIYENSLLPSMNVQTGDNHDKTIWILLSAISLLVLGYQAFEMMKKKKATIK